MSGDSSNFIYAYEGLTNTSTANLNELILNGQLITSLQNIPNGTNTYDILQWDASLQQYVVIPNTKIILGKDSVSTHNNTIVLNASGSALSTDGTSRLYINPIRNVQSNAGFLLYNFSTKEVSYSLTVPTFTTSGLTITTLDGTNPNRLVLSNGSKSLISSSYNEAQLGILSNVQTWTAQNTFSSSVVLALGSVGVPSLRFDSDTGLYSTGDGNLDISTNGTRRLNITDRIRTYGYINSAIVGSASNPNYAFDPDNDTGMYQTATQGELNFSCNSQQIINLSTTQASFKRSIRTEQGTNLIPSYSFTVDSDTGIYQSTGANIDFCSNGVNVFNISNLGLLVPNLTPLKIVLSDTNKRLISSVYNISDIPILSINNTFTGTTNTFNAITGTGLTLSGLTASRAIRTNTVNVLTSATFDLPANNGSSNSLMQSDGLGTTVWVNNISPTNIAVSNQILLASGSAINPSLIFTGGNTDTGIWSGAADTIRISTDGTTRCLITNTGLSVQNLTGNKIVLSNINNYLISSVYTDTDMFIKSINNTLSGVNTFSGNNFFTGSNVFSGTLNSFTEIYSQNIKVNSGTDNFLCYFQPTTKYISSLDPLSLPINTLTVAALALKLNVADPSCTGQFRLPSGGVPATPNLTFTSNLTTGIYSSGINTLNFSCGGTQELYMNTNGVYFTNGTVSFPSISFINETNTGIYRSGTNSLDFSIAGTRLLKIDNTTGITASALATFNNNIRLPVSTITLGLNSGAGLAGSDIIAIGSSAMQTGPGVAYGSDAIGIGFGANKTNYSANSIAIGVNACETGRATNLAQDTISIGRNANNLSAQSNSIAIGVNAGKNYNGISNIAIGNGALQTGVSTIGNTFQAIAIGTDAISTNTGSPNYSIAIGRSAGQTNMSANTIVLNASGSALNGSLGANRCFIAPIRSSATSYTVMHYDTTNKEVVAFTSSRRFKKNIESKKNFKVDDILKLNIVEYDAIDDNMHTACGVIAEECYDINPEFVNLDEEGKPISINYFNLMFYSIEKNKQQEKEIQSLKETIEKLKLSSDTSINERLMKIENFLSYKFNY